MSFWEPVPEPSPLISDWDRKQSRMQRDQEKEYGEWFIVRPMSIRPNKPTIVDRSRPEVRVRGIFTRVYKEDSFNPSALSSKGLKFTEMAQRQPRLDVRAESIPYELEQGDILIRCGNGVEYDVTVPQADGYGLLSVSLIERGTSANAP